MLGTLKLLDGGFSTQLTNYVKEPVDGDPLWTARFLAVQPKKCSYVHRDFVLAGAEIITTGSYQSSVEGYKYYLGMDTEQSLDVIKNSVQLARDGIELAEKETGKKFNNVKVAGSVGPYGASLHDGSEYTGSYGELVTNEQMMDWHRPRLAALVEGGADLIAFETVPCIREALALVELLKEFPGMKAWLSFSLKDAETISNGASFCEAASTCWKETDQLIAIGANCFHPSLVSTLCKSLQSNHPEIPLIAYPNNGQKYDVTKGRWLSKEDSVCIEDYVKEWMALGIKYFGGCCRTDASDIDKMLDEIKKWQRKYSN